MNRSKTGLAIVLALTVVLAGCASLGTQSDPTESATEAGGPTQTETPVTADAVKQQALTAMDGVQTYRVTAEESRIVEANLVQELAIEQVTDVDRPNEELHVSITQQAQGRTVESDIYMLEETLYQRHPRFVQQFSTAWISVNLSGNFSRAWEARDALARQRAILEIAEPSLNGTESIEGTDAHRLEASPDLDQLEEVFVELVTGTTTSANDSAYNISDGRFTFWIAQDTNRPLRVEGQINSTLSGPRRTIGLEQTFAFRYAYDSEVSITLPDGAADAVPLSEALNESSTGS